MWVSRLDLVILCLRRLTGPSDRGFFERWLSSELKRMVGLEVRSQPFLIRYRHTGNHQGDGPKLLYQAVVIRQRTRKSGWRQPEGVARGQ